MSLFPGTLSIRPISAKLLHNTEHFGKMAPYVKIKIGNHVEKTRAAKKMHMEPSWDEELIFNITDETMIDIEVKHKELIHDDLIGTASLSLNTWLNSNNFSFSEWVPLFYKEKDAGSLLLEMRFTPDAGFGAFNKNVGAQSTNLGTQQSTQNVVLGPVTTGVSQPASQTTVSQTTFVEKSTLEPILHSETVHVQEQPVFIKENPLVYEKEILQSRAELKALQAQVNPHFLFNTMEVLYRSLRQRGDRELAEFVITLSEFFRYTISRNQRDEWVTLEEEISHIEKYLQIMRKRLGVRLSWQIRLPQQLACVPIPKLLVQPIVENAIVHGIEEKIGEGKVTIAAWRKTKEEEIIIEVADDGVGMNGQALEALSGSIHTGDVPSAKGSGFGLANVERRLRLSYRYPPGTSSIQIDSREGEGTRVRITIPRERRET